MQVAAISTPYPSLSGEIFVYRSPPVSYKVSWSGHPPAENDKGTLLLSQMRLVLTDLTEAASSSSSAVIPLHQIFDEDIQQPIFGASNLQADLKRTAEVTAANPNQEVSVGKLYVGFRSGGLDPFLRVFLPFMANVTLHRSQIAQAYTQVTDSGSSGGGSGVSASGQQQGSSSSSGNTAYVDANDPRVLLIPRQ